MVHRSNVTISCHSDGKDSLINHVVCTDVAILEKSMVASLSSEGVGKTEHAIAKEQTHALWNNNLDR